MNHEKRGGNEFKKQTFITNTIKTNFMSNKNTFLKTKLPRVK